MSKWYVVIRGRTPGIYTSWSDCQSQVKGFSKALHKSFKSEQAAKTWFSENSGFIEDVDVKANPCGVTDVIPLETYENGGVDHDYDVVLAIFTDGSHQTSIDYVGLGAFCRYDGVEYEMSKTVDDELMGKYGIPPGETVSNPTAEFLGFAEVMCEFLDMRNSKRIKLNFYIDYVGVGHWMAETWQCKATYIKCIKELCALLIESTSCDVEIHHVPGHSGIEGNERADRCAKDTRNYNNFNKLVRSLQ